MNNKILVKQETVQTDRSSHIDNSCHFHIQGKQKTAISKLTASTAELGVTVILDELWREFAPIRDYSDNAILSGKREPGSLLAAKSFLL